MKHGQMTMWIEGTFPEITPWKPAFSKEMKREYPIFCAEFSQNRKIMWKVSVSP